MVRKPELDITRATPIRSESTKFKVAAGYFLLLSIVFFLAYITYENFRKIADSVESLSNSRNESTLVKRIATGINEIRTTSTIYSITFKPEDYSVYLQGTEYVKRMIDSLDIQLAENAPFDRIDSLKLIFTAYITSIRNWHLLKKANRSDDLQKIAGLIEDHGDSLSRSIQNAPQTTTITVRELTEEPAGADSAAITDEGKVATQKSFFRRLFGDRKKSNEAQPKARTINRQTITETYTKPDTAYFNQVDQILSKIKDTVTSTENTRKIRESQLARLEMLLLNYQGELITRINDLLKHIEIGERAILNQKITTSKKTAKDASKILVYAELSILVISLVFMFVIFADLTRSNYYKQMLEIEKTETEKLSKAKEKFLAMMSHEIRTPVNNIIGFSEQLQHTPLKSDQHQQVQTIVSSSKHLLALVNDILDFTKIESDSLTFENIGFSINDVVAEVLENLRFEAGKKSLQLTYDPPAHSSQVLVSGDPFRLKQVLINLVSNGIRFTETGYVKVYTSIKKTGEGYRLECHVRDTGIGIEKDKLDTIFSDFYQADTSITRRFGGTGLGLSICKKLIEKQKGSLWVRSTPGQGSVFSFEIPYQKASQNDYMIENRTYSENGDLLNNKKVLVIDDDDMIPSLLEPVFQSWQVIPAFSSNSDQAWNVLQQEGFDVIMLDIHLPGKDGFELLKRIRTDNHSKNKETRIVICTASVTFNPGETTGMPGEYPVLHKPFSKTDLWNILCMALETGEMEQDEVEGGFSRPARSYSLKSFRMYANEEPETLVLFIKTFISQTRNELSEMNHYSQRKNYREIREIAHKLKNTFGQLEARDLLTHLESLESLASDNTTDPQIIEDQISILGQACQNLFGLLEKEVQSAKLSD